MAGTDPTQAAQLARALAATFDTSPAMRSEADTALKAMSAAPAFAALLLAVWTALVKERKKTRRLSTLH